MKFVLDLEDMSIESIARINVCLLECTRKDAHTYAKWRENDELTSLALDSLKMQAEVSRKNFMRLNKKLQKQHPTTAIR